jgi:predicted MFS family arabinose efflux permease
VALWLNVFTGRTGRLAAGLMLAEFVTALQALVVITVLPQVAHNLQGYSYYGYAFSGYLAAQFILTPFAGAWVDRFGVRRVLLFTYPLLAFGLAFSGSAPTMGIFIVARIVEGAAGGMDAAIGLSTVAKVFPEEQRSRILALFSTMWAVPAVAGPTLGAFIAQTIGWRWAFYMFIPLVALSAALVVPNIGDTPAGESHPSDAVKMLFSRAVLRAQQGLPAGIAAFFFLFAAFFGADSFIPLYLTHERGQPLIIGGVAVMLSALGWSLSSIAVPRLRGTFSTSTLVFAAATLLVAGCGVLVAAAIVPIPVAVLLACWVMGGAGIGIAYTTIFSDVFERAEGGREGMVTSTALMAALLGMVVGTGLGGLALMIAQRAGHSINTGILAAFCVALLAAIALLSIAGRTRRAF